MMEANPKWLLQDTVIESLKILEVKYNLTYDVVGVLPEHIRTVLTVTEKVPELKNGIRSFKCTAHFNKPALW